MDSIKSCFRCSEKYPVRSRPTAHLQVLLSLWYWLPGTSPQQDVGVE